MSFLPESKCTPLDLCSNIKGEVDDSNPIVTAKLCVVCLTSNSGEHWQWDVADPTEGREPICTIVQKHLGLVIDEIPQCQTMTICSTCWGTVSDFHTFYGMVHEAHEKQLALKSMVTIDTTLRCRQDEPNASHVTEFVKVPKRDPDSVVVDTAIGSNPVADPITVEIRDSSDLKDSPSRTSKDGKTVDQEILEFYKRIVCEICDSDRMARGEPAVEYSTLKELNRHMRSEHSVEHAALRCPVCKKKYRTRVQLLKHREMHLHPDRFRCPTCREVHHNMEEHRKMRHGERDHSCPHCEKRFAIKGRLALHVRVAHGVRDVICEECNKPFNKYTIEEHRRVVHRSSFICEFCSKPFKTRFWLNRHKEEHSESAPNIRAVTCTICETVVKNKYILVAHMRRVHCEKAAVSCKVCGKSFKSRNSLSKHLRNVCTDRRFPCAICGRPFKQQAKLTQHMTTHTGVAPYVCTFCPRTFKYEAQFYNHRKRAHHEQWLEMRQKRKEGHRQIGPPIPATGDCPAVDVA